MFKIFFSLFLCTFSSFSSAETTYPEAGWRTLRKEEKDFNGDNKVDQAYWLTMSKSLNAAAERLLIVANQRPVLDFRSTFCEPSGQNGFANSEKCTSLVLGFKPDKKMVMIKDLEKSTLDEERSQDHRYEFKKDVFVPVSAHYQSSRTGQMQERDFEVIDIDYSKNSVKRNRWIEFGADKKVKNKRSDKCELKKTPKDGELHLYEGFSVVDEIKCKG